ncbi:MAG: DMT family transporter [Geminicoccaceae bacterium]|nr:DMT family transporter [Geminicoccaceae bacterium]
MTSSSIPSATVAAPPARPDNIRGAMLMVGSSAFFTANDATIKFLSDTVPIGQLLAMRGFVVVVLLFLIMRWRGERPCRSDLFERANVLRAVIDLAVTFVFLTAIILLPLAIATVLVFTTPVFLTIIAALFLGERVGLPRWLAVLAGFAGVVLVADPGGDFDPLMLLPVAGALMMACRDVVTRMIPPRLPARAVALTSALFVAVAGLLTAPLGDWVVPTATDWIGSVICAGFVATAHTLLVSSVRTGEISFVAAFRYTAILLALTLGYLVWGDVPTVNGVAGGLVIITSGVVIFYREHRRASLVQPEGGA